MSHDENEENNRIRNAHNKRIQDLRDSAAADRKRMDHINDKLSAANPGGSGNSSRDSGTGGGGGGCFIATAAFESADSPELVVLRSFRDRRLMPSMPGRWLVRCYYRIGPHCASVVARHPRLKAVVRRALEHICVRIERGER